MYCRHCPSPCLLMRMLLKIPNHIKRKITVIFFCSSSSDTTGEILDTIIFFILSSSSSPSQSNLGHRLPLPSSFMFLCSLLSDANFRQPCAEPHPANAFAVYHYFYLLSTLSHSHEQHFQPHFNWAMSVMTSSTFVLVLISVFVIWYLRLGPGIIRSKALCIVLSLLPDLIVSVTVSILYAGSEHLSF